MTWWPWRPPPTTAPCSSCACTAWRCCRSRSRTTGWTWRPSRPACAAGAGSAAALHDPQLPEPLRRDALGRQARRPGGGVRPVRRSWCWRTTPTASCASRARPCRACSRRRASTGSSSPPRSRRPWPPGCGWATWWPRPTSPPVWPRRRRAPTSPRPSCPEAAIHALIEGGHLPDNIARVTGLMRERRDAMVAGLRHMPEGTRCVPPAGGFFCWLTLPEGLSADDALRRRGAGGHLLRQGQRLRARGRRAHAEAGLQRREPLRDRGGHGAARGGLPRRPRPSLDVSDPDKPPRWAGPGRDR